MENLITRIKSHFANKSITFETLTDFVLSTDFSKLDVESHIPDEIHGDYSRNIMLLDPLEVVVIYWPPQIESAIHHHEDFFGHVVVTQGQLSNVEYSLNDGVMREERITDAGPFGVLPEEEGVIHKLWNRSEEPAVSIHFYYPTLESFDKMEIFDITTERKGILNDKAVAASWQSPDDHFHSIENDAYTFIEPGSEPNGKSHRIHPVIPKPDKAVIVQNITRYYQEQAEHYDSFDLKHASRKAYINRINELVAHQLQSLKAENVLHLASGTGRRAKKIQNLTGINYRVLLADVSPAMLAKAKKYGYEYLIGDVMSLDLENSKYDACTMLYAFGHITSSEERLNVAQNVYRWLKPGGCFLVDVFNLHNKNEWGPASLETYRKMHLDQFGYEKGDVFYVKNGGKEVAFLHYFEEAELIHLFESAGFEIEFISYVGYAKRSGELLEDKNQGSFFVTARKPI